MRAKTKKQLNDVICELYRAQEKAFIDAVRVMVENEGSVAFEHVLSFGAWIGYDQDDVSEALFDKFGIDENERVFAYSKEGE